MKKLKYKILLIIFFVIVDVLLFFNFYGQKFSENTSYLIKIKIKELSRYYLNSTIKKYLNLDTNNYIIVNTVNNNIVSVDLDSKSTNLLLSNIINDLENNIGIISEEIFVNYKMESLDNKMGVILYVPIGIISNNTLLAGLGPRIPIRTNFLESVESYVDVEVDNYGINNSLIKLYINISLKVVIEMPLDKEIMDINYKYLLSSKLINGKVPNFYGNGLIENSGIVKNDVNY